MFDGGEIVDIAAIVERKAGQITHDGDRMRAIRGVCVAHIAGGIFRDRAITPIDGVIVGTRIDEQFQRLAIVDVPRRDETGGFGNGLLRRNVG